jgi:hypothetical protein
MGLAYSSNQEPHLSENMPTTIQQVVSDIQRAVADLSKAIATMPQQRKLAIINSSTGFTLTPAILEALQIQLTRDFMAAWNIDYKLITAANAAAVPADAYLNIIDASDTPGALGWHDQLNGRPFGEVFVNESKAAGVDLITVISHEMLELSADPLVNALQLFQPSGGQAQLYAVEVGDPVESDSYAITTSDGTKVNVSNFVFPSYFSNGPGPWDQLKKLSGPLPNMTTGGYLAFLNVNVIGGWQQVNARLAGTSKNGVINPE